MLSQTALEIARKPIEYSRGQCETARHALFDAAHHLDQIKPHCSAARDMKDAAYGLQWYLKTT